MASDPLQGLRNQGRLVGFSGPAGQDPDLVRSKQESDNFDRTMESIRHGGLPDLPPPPAMPPVPQYHPMLGDSAENLVRNNADRHLDPDFVANLIRYRTSGGSTPMSSTPSNVINGPSLAGLLKAR